MSTATETTTKIPQPDFPHRAYGVDVTWLGDEGGMAARGHIPDSRFIAACNHLARTEAGMANLWDDRSASLEDALVMVTRVWALPVDPAKFGSEWAVDYGRDITEQTPGAIPLTVMLP